MVRLLPLILLSLIPLMSSAQKTLTASGSYTYRAPSNITLDQARSIALERAKVEIIAEQFGTVVGVTNTSRTDNNGTEFLSIGESEVKGEWLGTVGEPHYEIDFDQNMLVVKVTVSGKIREIISSRIDCEVRILRNGTEDRFESAEFRDNDDIFISFKAPVNGYLAIFLYDKKGVFRLLPLKSQQEGSFQVEANKKNVFFQQKLVQYSVAENKTIEQIKSTYQLTCENGTEWNRLYAVFSPHQFAHAADIVSTNPEQPACLSFEAFQKWLVKARRQDVDMSVTIRDICISK